MARNKMSDLSDHLFAQLERLNDEEIPKEEMELEFKKAKAIGQVSGQIIKVAALTVAALKLTSSGNMNESTRAQVENKLLS